MYQEKGGMEPSVACKKGLVWSQTQVGKESSL